MSETSTVDGTGKRRREPEDPALTKRRKAAVVFVVVYVTFCLAVIVLMAFRSHELGLGWV